MKKKIIYSIAATMLFVGNIGYTNLAKVWAAEVEPVMSLTYRMVMVPLQNGC